MEKSSKVFVGMDVHKGGSHRHAADDHCIARRFPRVRCAAKLCVISQWAWPKTMDRPRKCRLGADRSYGAHGEARSW